MSAAASHWRRIALLLMLLPWAVPFGCGGDTGSQPSGGPSAGGGPTIVKAEGLPGLDPALGPLDNGRVMVAPLSGWYVPVRNSDYVIRFRLARDIAYPKILVTAADYEPIFDLSPENVEQFATQAANEIAQRGEAAGLVSVVGPILIGGRPAVTYQRRGKSGKQIVERYFLETVAGGRRYTLELRALQGTLSEFQPYAWALLHGMEFLEQQAPSPPEQPQPGPEEPGQEPSGQTGGEPAGETTEPPGAEAGETPAGEPDTGEESSTPQQPPESSDSSETPSVIPDFEEELPPN